MFIYMRLQRKHLIYANVVCNRLLRKNINRSLQMEIIIRIGLNKDLKEIVEITNQAIRTKIFTGFTEEFTVNGRKRWFKEHIKSKYPILVAENEGKIVGWISISPYRSGRKALEKTVEVSYFVHEDYKRKGIGNKISHLYYGKKIKEPAADNAS